MPNQCHSGILGDPWARCDRCGWDYRLSQLVMQNGLLLCLTKCWDDPEIFGRDRDIQEALTSTDTEGQPMESLKRSEDVPEELQN